MTVVARPLDNPLLDARLTAMREKTGCRVVSKRDAARTLLKTLRAGGVVGILADQRARPPDAVVVPFFGRPGRDDDVDRAARREDGRPHPPRRLPAGRPRALPARLLRAARRERRSRRRSAGWSALTARVTALVESQVRAAPEQWLWLHDRWRS